MAASEHKNLHTSIHAKKEGAVDPPGRGTTFSGMTYDDIEIMNENTETPSTGTAFLLWLACIFGLAGVHRFYLKKPWTGLLYLLTFGIFGIGQLVDLFNLRDMVDLQRARNRALKPAPQRRLLPAPRKSKSERERELRRALRGAALANGGFISVRRAASITGKPLGEVEERLDELVVDGQADIDNHPTTGEVVYTFTPTVA